MLELGASFADRTARARRQRLVVDGDLVLVGVRQNSQPKQALVDSLVDRGLAVFDDLVMCIAHPRAPSPPLVQFARRSRLRPFWLVSGRSSGRLSKVRGVLCVWLATQAMQSRIGGVSRSSNRPSGPLNLRDRAFPAAESLFLVRNGATPNSLRFGALAIARSSLGVEGGDHGTCASRRCNSPYSLRDFRRTRTCGMRPGRRADRPG